MQAIRAPKGILNWAATIPVLLASLLLWTACETTPVDNSQEALMQRMQSSNPDIAAAAMQSWEKTYPTSTNAFGILRSRLSDPSSKVRRKAGRVLGILHAEVSQADIDAICAMLTSTDTAEVIDALKSLRGLKAPSAVEKILPLLDSPVRNVVRDSCRTLAVLGGPDLIPKLEPLLTHPEPAVRQDAQDAIFILRGKSA